MMRMALILVLLASAVAHADGEPWKVGVTPDRMAAAKKLLDEGNELLLARDWQAALAKYQAAIEQWDHPGIRFNVVKCLVQLDRTIEAVDNLELALKYGAAPLDETVYGEALAYQKMLAKQVATVSVQCKQPDVDVRLDGQPLGACPGTNKRRVVPGPHQVVGKRAGYFTHTVDLVVIGGMDQNVDVVLDPLGENGKVVHRWAAWVPWSVIAGGVVAGVAGGLLESRALSNRDEYNKAVASCGSDGCDPDYRAHLKDTATLENRTAIGLWVTAGAAVAVGGVLLYLNRGHTVYTKQTEKLEPTASVTPHGATVGITGSF